MNKPVHTVALVVDPEFGERAVPLSEQRHVWLVSSERNRAAAEQQWEKEKLVPPRRDPLGGGISMFDGKGATPEEVAVGILDMLTEHHNEWSHDPPMTLLEIHGAKRTPELEDALDEYGLYITHEGDRYLVAELDE